MGPSCSGIRVENFVIMQREEENAMGILNSSAQFCKMSVDFFYEEVDYIKGRGKYLAVN